MGGLKTEIRHAMRIEWDVAIMMDGGLTLRGDVVRPVADGRYPIILSYGPYAKGLAFHDGYPSAWQPMVAEHPDVAHGSTNRYQTGKSSIRKSGRPTAMSACASTRAAPAVRPITSIISPRARRRTATDASSGPPPRRGRMAKSGSTASRTPASTNDMLRRCSRRISSRCACGKAPPIGIET